MEIGHFSDAGGCVASVGYLGGTGIDISPVGRAVCMFSGFCGMLKRDPSVCRLLVRVILPFGKRWLVGCVRGSVVSISKWSTVVFLLTFVGLFRCSCAVVGCGFSSFQRRR